VDGSTVNQTDVHYSGPIVVLVNENTASAAEIVAGALQDNGRAVIVGQRTYGKSVVQSITALPDGGALHLTTEDYYLPVTGSIQGVGLTPDVLIAQSSDEHESLRIQRSDLRPDLHRFTPETFAVAFGYAPVADSEIETAASLIRAVTPNFVK
jgi:carboxyl-terminal processing protease